MKKSEKVFDIIRLTEDMVLLLQVGENGFNDEGVFRVLISPKDLAQRNFDH